MLHYPHLKIPEERFAWIYPLSVQLEPRADIYLWEKHQQDIKDTWPARLEGKELQTYGEGKRLETMCLPLLKQYPRIHCFFFYLVDSYLMQGQLEYSRHLVNARKQWMIQKPYKVIGSEWTSLGVDQKMTVLAQFGYRYYTSMTDWIEAMRTIQFYEIDVDKKIAEGFVFKARLRRKAKLKP